ncbi:hypothetical protein [Tissierella sp. P1]|uniref:hypothetical protein n=1 Tax=Tissierella sp. P1 TaxID=1280483 RepID=UPI001F42218D|nr:hypothetical protein [Tissierella sp. P1]
MKFGPRKLSFKKRISARTSIKRQMVHRGGLKMLGDMDGLEILRNMYITRFIIEPPLIFLNYSRNCLNSKSPKGGNHIEFH